MIAAVDRARSHAAEPGRRPPVDAAPQPAPSGDTVRPVAPSVDPGEPLAGTLSRCVQRRAALQRQITKAGFAVAQKSLVAAFTTALSAHNVTPASLPSSLAAELKRVHSLPTEYDLDKLADVRNLVVAIGGTLAQATSWSNAVGSPTSTSSSASSSSPPPVQTKSPSPKPLGTGPSPGLGIPAFVASGPPKGVWATKPSIVPQTPPPTLTTSTSTSSPVASEPAWQTVEAKTQPEQRTVRQWFERAGFALAPSGNTWRRDLTAKAKFESHSAHLHVTINVADVGKASSTKTAHSMRQACLARWHVTVMGSDSSSNLHAYYERDSYIAEKSTLEDIPAAKSEAKGFINAIGT